MATSNNNIYRKFGLQLLKRTINIFHLYNESGLRMKKVNLANINQNLFVDFFAQIDATIRLNLKDTQQ